MTNLSSTLKEDLPLIKKKMQSLERFLKEKSINKQKCFQKWFEDFKNFYTIEGIEIQLYLIHCVYYFLGYILFYNFIILKEKELKIRALNRNIIKKIDEWFDNNSIKNNPFKIEYFFAIKELYNSFSPLIDILIKNFISIELSYEFFFDLLTRELIPSIVRHKSGEYYTPPFLAKKMINEVYEFGELVLDPCCGTGNFLIEIIKLIINSDKTDKEKVLALNRLYGYDINPISIFASYISILIVLRNYMGKVNLNLYVVDSLFDYNIYNDRKFNLIIGNPPWYTYRDIQSIEYQKKIKKLAGDLEIKPLPKNILNIEISTLFFYNARKHFMKIGAKIFLVITKGVITGSHTDKFRRFKGFTNIRAWLFNGDLLKIFNIDFLCLYAEKSTDESIPFPLEIPVIYFEKQSLNTKIQYYDNIELISKKSDYLVPYSIEKKRNSIYVKKLILKKDKELLIPSQSSYYKKLFHKGADLNPRNLVFVICKKINEELIEINPDERIYEKSKHPWTDKVYSNEIVERDNIFNVVKSTELVKFGMYNHYQVFLPLIRKEKMLIQGELKKNSAKFYEFINSIYLRNKKKTTHNKTLLENLNRWGKLINERQISPIKVVYNNSGSKLNAALIEGNFLVTGDLSFYITDDLNEAYYLLAVLNSQLMTQQVRIRKSSRHIFKLPLEIPIKKFDASCKNHMRLAYLGKKCNEIVRLFLENLKKNKIRISKIKVQNELEIKLKTQIKEIDEALISDLKKTQI
ncbi:MAG: N-6 DNA methylase [Promethearchaeota archaeon]